MKSVSDVRATIANVLYHEGDVEYRGEKTYGAKEFGKPISVSLENMKDKGKTRNETAYGMYLDPTTGDIVVDVKMSHYERISAKSWEALYNALVEG